MAVIPAFLLRFEAVVEPLTGEGSHGPVFGAPVTVRCFWEDKKKVSKKPDGSELISSTTVWMLPTEVCPAGSRITVNGRTARVLASSLRVGGGLPTPDHLEVEVE